METQFSSQCSDTSTSDSESAACSLEDENCTQNDSHEDNENNEDILEGSDYHEPETQINFMDDCHNDSSCIANQQYDQCDISNLPVLLSPSLVETAVRTKVSSFPEEFSKDKDNANFPKSVLKCHEQNGDIHDRDWLVWSPSKKTIFVFLVTL